MSDWGTHGHKKAKIVGTAASRSYQLIMEDRRVLNHRNRRHLLRISEQYAVLMKTGVPGTTKYVFIKVLLLIEQHKLDHKGEIRHLFFFLLHYRARLHGVELDMRSALSLVLRYW